ncbi:hypothetical protein W04_3361 [Pseudoalteromonas sp. SW0106-04]|nr:hypothetical protein W04_3361 [Pseudoalteromonas sp. SW0106-04]
MKKALAYTFQAFEDKVKVLFNNGFLSIPSIWHKHCSY